MDIINIVESVQQWHFLEHETLAFDLIVWEKLPQNPDKKYQHRELSDLQYDFGIAGKLTALTQENKRVLVIVETISALYLAPWLSQIPSGHTVSVLQVNTGISGFMSKASPDLNDIATLMPYAKVAEVYDQTSLIDALQYKGVQYIRLAYGETHSELFPEKTVIDGGLVDMRAHNFEGLAGTVIAPGGLLVSAIHALQHLQQEWKSFDLFGLVDYDFSIGKALKESIVKTENIVVLLDQQKWSLYESVVKAKLWDSGLVDTQIYFIYPDIEKINTILPEYLWDEANRDGLGIAEKIHSLR